MTEGNIHLSNIRVKRAGKTILNVEKLQIKSGDFLGIIGTNGAGKTTLLRLCCGLIKPNSGSITLDSKDFSR
jgi:ABC-type cobalamin/Fe3+-siderophores transport system ATPase subunit